MASDNINPASQMDEDSKKENEPLLTYLLPASQVACWCLFAWNVSTGYTIHAWVAGSCCFYWLWAVKNRIAGPLRSDLGVFSFFPGLMSGACEIIFQSPSTLSTIGCLVGCVLPWMNFVGFLPRLGWTLESFSRKARKMGKTWFWGQVMWYYSISNIAYWTASAAFLIRQLAHGLK
mmetsp:Transcript_24516/g.39292  ORF Transcript_24516/g.39292 Transcript_24516/m.39292 type:complete len:176 (+) Transcript_24516:52-579(+)